MIKLDNKHLLMIEPVENKTESPLDDIITDMAREVYKNTKLGLRFRGFHCCICGTLSDCSEHITKMGRITNSLMLHYVRYHRHEILEYEIEKLREEYNHITRHLTRLKPKVRLSDAML